MCFVLYVASKSKPVLIPWDDKAPSFNSEEISQTQKHALEKRFRNPSITYVGTDYGCGCNFRYIPLEATGQPLADEFYSRAVEAQEKTQPNHQNLQNYLRTQFSDEDFIELYGCWDGDEDLPEEFALEIPLEQVGDPGFCFKERGYYFIRVNKQPQSTSPPNPKTG